MAMALSNDQNMCTGIFMKTKMCKFKKLGICNRGAACTYAHTQRELQPLPDLFRTKMCFIMSKSGKCKDPRCPYAHTKQELRQVNYENEKQRFESGMSMQVDEEMALPVGPYFQPAKFYCVPVMGVPWMPGQLNWDAASQSTMSGDASPFPLSPSSNTDSGSNFGSSSPKMHPAGEDTSCSISQASVEESDDNSERQAELCFESGVSRRASEPFGWVRNRGDLPNMNLIVKNTFLQFDTPIFDNTVTTCVRRCSSCPDFSVTH
jgi:hypothetical protein